jgi:DNA-binding LacI/PurR family transcriptional regulator
MDRIAKPKLVKLVDVAHAAGVSRGTASNVYTHPELVRPALIERVRAAAAKLGYGGPNPKGRLLRTGKVNAIGVTPPGAYGTVVAFDNPYFNALCSGIATVCDDRGASLTIVPGFGADKFWGIKNALVDGFIIHWIEDAAVIEARGRRLPFVLLDMDGDKETNSVRVDDRTGTRAIAQHLVDLGHRRFAIVSVTRRDTLDAPGLGAEPIFHPPGETGQRLVKGFPIDDARLGGYADALATAGLSIDAMPIVECRADTVAKALPGARLLFERAPDVTAVLAMSDVQALAVIAEAKQRGISVPSDLSVVGFDDIPEAAVSQPPLTTVVQPTVEKGRLAAAMLFDRTSVRHEVLGVKLVLRASTSAPRRAARETKKGRARPAG